MSPLSLTEDNFRDHAIDYLDELMAPEERAAFERALSDHPAWRTYVDDLSTTWRRARRALVQGEEKAPARIRTHVLAEAAKRAAILRQAQVPAVAPAAESPWVWVKRNLLARPWFAPAFVAATAVGIFVFSQQTFKAARPSAVVAEAVRQEAPVSADLIQNGTSALLDRPKPREPSQLSAPAAAPAVPSAPVEEQASSGRMKAKVGRTLAAKEEKAERVQREEFDGKAPTKKSQVQLPKRRDLADDALDSEEGAALGGLGAARGGGAAEPRKDESKGFASPPAGWAAANRASPAAPPPPALAEPAREADLAQAAPAEREAASVAPAAASPPRSRPASSAGAPSADVRSDAPRDKAEPSRADLVTKAENAERDEAWQLAVDTYRQLLRRFPADKNSARWKQRLAAASAHLR